MNRVPWRRDDTRGLDGNDATEPRDQHGIRHDADAAQPDFDLRLRDADADTEPERPLLVWPQDDTPRMGRAAGAAYLAFLVLLAFAAVWVVERDVEGPVPVAEPRASEESPLAEARPPVEPDVPPAPPTIDDLALNGVDPAAPPDLPALAGQRPAPDVPRTRQLPSQQDSPRPTVTPAPRPRTDPVPNPPPQVARVEPAPPPPPRPAPPGPAPLAPRLATPEPAAVPPARAAISEPPEAPPRPPATESVTLPRVAVADPSLAPPPAPANVPAAPPPAATPAPAPPAAPPAAAASAPSTAARADVENGAIRDVLGRYRSAFNALNAKAAQQVWPSVDERTLDKAFGQLQEQNVSFDQCTIEVKGVLAEASCSGTTRFVPRVGNRSPQVEPRRWSFSLRKAFSGGWQIQEVKARRSE